VIWLLRLLLPLLLLMFFDIVWESCMLLYILYKYVHRVTNENRQYGSNIRYFDISPMLLATVLVILFHFTFCQTYCTSDEWYDRYVHYVSGCVCVFVFTLPQMNFIYTYYTSIYNIYVRVYLGTYKNCGECATAIRAYITVHKSKNVVEYALLVFPVLHAWYAYTYTHTHTHTALHKQNTKYKKTAKDNTKSTKSEGERTRYELWRESKKTGNCLAYSQASSLKSCFLLFGEKITNILCLLCIFYVLNSTILYKYESIIHVSPLHILYCM
jgi:hypothetical protein